MKELKAMILDGLQKCTTPQQDFFKHMYPCNTPVDTIVDCVMNIPNHKLEWAYKQILNTIAKNETRLASIIEPTIQQSPPQAPPSTKKKTLTINTRDNSIVRLYTHEVIDENQKIVYEGISYEQCMSYIELEELQR
jgi:hypothetical protein